jgi:pyruvyltransferase
MKMYYWTKVKNFGDLLSPLLVKRFCHLDSTLSTPEDSELVMTGSILEHLPHDYKGVIAGCGKLHRHSKLHLKHAKILGVRGHLSAHGLHGNHVIGDPGLLADELVPVVDKQYNLGIVPHWTDNELEHNPIFLKFNPLIIRAYGDPQDVITQISKCKKIVSSSLHGIILADALGIPRRIELPPRTVSHPHIEGDTFKWEDYSSSIGMKLTIGLTQEADRRIITAKQHELFDMMTEIQSLFKHECHRRH